MSHVSNPRHPELDRLLKEVMSDHSILAVILFGSSARGESGRDVDICLVDYPNKLSAQQELHYRTTFAEPLDIHAFSSLPLYIQYQVINEGQILLDKEYDLLFDIYWKTIQDYSLFLPHYEAFLGME